MGRVGRGVGKQANVSIPRASYPSQQKEIYVQEDSLRSVSENESFSTTVRLSLRY